LQDYSHCCCLHKCDNTMDNDCILNRQTFENENEFDRNNQKEVVSMVSYRRNRFFHICLYIYYPILIKRTEIFPGFFICDITTIGFLTIHMTLVLIDSCLIPFVILTITSVLTIRVLIRSSNSIERTGNLSKERRSRDRKYAITSVALNTIFIVLKLPSTIFLLMFASYFYFDVYFYNIGNLLFFLNSSIGFSSF
jgi:hypothetical protein